jgi:hypothetical protein
LFERQVHRSHVSTATIEYYSFHVVSDEEAESVSFKLSVEIGDATFWISRRTKYPNNTNYERISSMHRNLIEFEKGLEKSLQGSYYIAVRSSGNTYYSITPLVGRSHKSFEDVRVFNIKLTEGFMERISYEGEDELYYFEFTVQADLFNEIFEETEVFIWVEKIVGR